MSRSRKLILALLVSLVAGGLAAGLLLGSATAPERATAVVFGFNNNAVTEGVASASQSAGLLARMGADVDRVQINWAMLEPARGEYDFAVYDQIYEADLAEGVKPLFIFAFAPGWAAGNAPCDTTTLGCHVPPDPEHYEDAARTAAEIARRYPRAAGIEIWNEPNTSHFWAPQPDPDAYAKLLAYAYRAIKEVAPNLPVAGAATASGSGSGSVPDSDFIRALLAKGGGAAMDALSVHAYPVPGDATGYLTAEGVDKLRAIETAGGSTDPIWVTETGISTTGTEAVSDTDQAATLVRLTQALSGVDGVEMVLVHTLVRQPSALGDAEGGFGVIRSDLSPTPASCALSVEWQGESC